jgi:hypothetical protein
VNENKNLTVFNKVKERKAAVMMCFEFMLKGKATRREGKNFVQIDGNKHNWLKIHD